jgi:uncharacterized protein YegP (UPF0339 family)
VSTESIASPPTPVGSPQPCARCGALLADDQRYCLECGERQVPISSVLLGGVPAIAGTQSQPQSPQPPASGSPSPPEDSAGRSSAVTVIAGVGVLLLAMGVGVLIGRSGASRPAAAPAEVITVAPSGAATTPVEQPAATPFSGDWPAGTNGYTVQLQKLGEAGSAVSAVEAAKSSASGQGAKGVGALKSGDFASLTAGSYIVYSGVYHKRAEAEKALKALKKNFPHAEVIKVSKAASSSPAKTSKASTGAADPGASQAHPAPPSVIEALKKNKNESAEERSKNIPNVVETG